MRWQSYYKGMILRLPWGMMRKGPVQNLMKKGLYIQAGLKRRHI